MFFLAALFAAGQILPTVGMMEGRSSEQAGDAILAGQDHGKVEKIERVPLYGPYPPGMLQYNLIERSTPSAGGCVRTRWVADFIRGPNDTDSTARLSSVSAVTDVALPSAGGCVDRQFVPISPEISPRDAIGALIYFEGVRVRPSTIILSCVDKTPGHLCRKTGAIRRGIADGEILSISREGATVAIDLLMKGPQPEPITTVRFSRRDPIGLKIQRAFPPPF